MHGNGLGISLRNPLACEDFRVLSTVRLHRCFTSSWGAPVRVLAWFQRRWDGRKCSALVSSEVWGLLLLGLGHEGKGELQVLGLSTRTGGLSVGHEDHSGLIDNGCKIQ